MGGHSAAAGLALLGLALLAAPSLAREVKDEKVPVKDSSGGEMEIQGTSILVTTNSEGVTEVYVGKPNITVTDIMQFISSTMNPFSRFARSLNTSPLVTALLPAYYAYTLAPSPYSQLDLARNSMVLVAPIRKENPGRADEALQEDYAAYILPKGLSSLPREMTTKLLTAAEGMKKIGLLMFPPDVDHMGVTGRQPSNQLFPLENVRVREIKVIDGDAKTTKLDAVLDSFGFARPGYSGSPWLILMDVAAEKVGQKEQGPSDAGSPPTAAVREDRADPAAEGVADADPVKQFGTIYVSKDGSVSWQSNPFVGRVTYLPIPSIPFPPPMQFPRPFPWFDRTPFSNPFYMPFTPPPIPFWNVIPHNPFVLPVQYR